MKCCFSSCSFSHFPQRTGVNPGPAQSRRLPAAKILALLSFFAALPHNSTLGPPWRRSGIRAHSVLCLLNQRAWRTGPSPRAVTLKCAACSWMAGEEKLQVHDRCALPEPRIQQSMDFVSAVWGTHLVILKGPNSVRGKT